MKDKIVNFLILHNVRSIYNVGAIFRTAEAVGISRIYLTGYTPTPLDRFGKPRKDLAKSALGAEKIIPWQSYKNIGSLLKRLKKEKVKIIAIEQASCSVDYKKVKISASSAFIVGNEVKGLSKSILNKCDIVAEIPMKGQKESLNVSVSAGVALFRILGV